MNGTAVSTKKECLGEMKKCKEAGARQWAGVEARVEAMRSSAAGVENEVPSVRGVKTVDFGRRAAGKVLARRAARQQGERGTMWAGVWFPAKW